MSLYLPNYITITRKSLVNCPLCAGWGTIDDAHIRFTQIFFQVKNMEIIHRYGTANINIFHTYMVRLYFVLAEYFIVSLSTHLLVAEVIELFQQYNVDMLDSKDSHLFIFPFIPNRAPRNYFFFVVTKQNHWKI